MAHKFLTLEQTPLKRRAFTLVELLVVIGIISALVGILMPVLVKVRTRALTTQCMTNLRGIATGWTMYAANNRGIVAAGRLPKYDGEDSFYGMGEGEQYRPRWYELLGAEVKSYATRDLSRKENDSWTIESRLFLCPVRPEWNNSRNYPYGYNYQFLGNARPFGATYGQLGGGKVEKWIKYPVRASSIKGSQTVMAMDCAGTAAGKPTYQRNAYYPDGTKDEAAWGNKGWAVDPPRLTARSDMADPERRSPENRSGPDPRHGGRIVVAFCDGHVDVLSLSDLGYVAKPDGSILANGPGTHNRLFSGSGEDKDPPPAF